MKYDKNNLLLFVENNYKGVLIKTKDKRLKSTKTDAENHGVGLSSVYRKMCIRDRKNTDIGKRMACSVQIRWKSYIN